MRQLLRGAVNWNAIIYFFTIRWHTSAPAWSCELKSIFEKTFWDNQKSAPAWSCELKSSVVCGNCICPYVSSCVELWIEITRGKRQWNARWVSSCVELWIEIHTTLSLHKSKMSAPAWSCELKSIGCNYNFQPQSQLLRGAVNWNLRESPQPYQSIVSAPAWSCELKYVKHF